MHQLRYTSLLFILLAASAAIADPAPQVTVRTDHDDALYRVNEAVQFIIGVTRGVTPVSEGTINYTLTRDGFETIDQGEKALDGTPLMVSGTLDQPGFLRCTVTYPGETDSPVWGVAAAGVDPSNIPPSMPVPDDFDAFWSAKRAALDDLPMNPRLTPVATDVSDTDTFDLQLDCLGGAPVSGYYSKPTDAKPKSLPAILWLHGAGVRSSIRRANVAAEGFLVLDINAHGIPNGEPQAFYADLSKGELANYRLRGRDDRESYYFLGMYYRLMRALDFLTAQPEWDQEVLIARGSSQGGGQALVAAGLDSRVTALLANVPAMCDHTGDINGWPRLVPRNGQGQFDPVIQNVARYFDAMNFAARTKAGALVSVGFIDTTCRPTSVYAAYNNLTGQKEMLHYPEMTHKVPPDWREKSMQFMKAHIARVK